MKELTKEVARMTLEKAKETAGNLTKEARAVLEAVPAGKMRPGDARTRAWELKIRLEAIRSSILEVRPHFRREDPEWNSILAFVDKIGGDIQDATAAYDVLSALCAAT